MFESVSDAGGVTLDDDSCWRAAASTDARFDGQFVTAVRTTGIYCRPSCPAQTPKRVNVRFYKCAAAAVAAGFRACKRCRPEAAPGSREWDVRGDLAAKALRAISAGAVDEVGVPGLAASMHVSERHLNRVLMTEVGAGPLALARTRRAQTARLLLAATELSAEQIAFASGFGSVRQFNDTMKAHFGCTPAQLRQGTDKLAAAGSMTVRLAHRPPYDTTSTLLWLQMHAVDSIEAVDTGNSPGYRRVLADGSVMTLRPAPDGKAWLMSLPVEDVGGLAAAVSSARRLLDSDADPMAVDTTLQADPLLRPLVRIRPGIRVPGSTDGWELAVRVVIAQQVSLAAARTFTARLIAAYGKPLDVSRDGLTHAFPTASALAEASYDGIGLTTGRAKTLRSLATAVANGELSLDPATDRDEAIAGLLRLPGIGPWTTSLIAMRAFADPDAWPGSDLVLKRAAATSDPQRWAPWRASAAMHLWIQFLTDSTGNKSKLDKTKTGAKS